MRRTETRYCAFPTAQGAVRQRALEVDDGEVIGEENVADVRKGEVVVVIVLLQLIHPDAGGLSAVSADGEVPRCGQRDENRTVLLVDGDGLVILVEQDVVCVARLTVCVLTTSGSASERMSSRSKSSSAATNPGSSRSISSRAVIRRILEPPW